MSWEDKGEYCVGKSVRACCYGQFHDIITALTWTNNSFMKKGSKIPNSKADIIIKMALAQISLTNSVYFYPLHVLALFLGHLGRYTHKPQPTELPCHTV